jgi:Beta-1,3-glucanase
MPLFQKAISRFQSVAAAKSRSRARRLQIESLEERSLLSTVPFYITDQTNLDPTRLAYTPDNIFFALYGQNVAGDKYYYFDLDQNNFVQTGTQGTVPAYALNQLTWDDEHSAFVVSPPLDLPDDTYGIASARLYFAMGPAGQAALHPQINGDGSISPPANTLNAYFDYVEFSLNQPMTVPQPGNLNIDTTNVDQFGVPIQVAVDSSDIGTQQTPVGTAAARADLITHFQNFSAGTVFPQLLWENSGPWGPFRIVSPGHVLTQASDAQTVVSVQTTLGANVATGDQSIIVRQPLTGFPDPSEGNFTVQLAGKYGIEEMTVTGQSPSSIPDTVTWNVTRIGTKRTFSPGDTVRFVDMPGSPAINSTQTTIQVGGMVDFPPLPFPIEVGQEIMVVTSQSGSNGGLPIWEVQRGAYGSQATAHANNELVSYNYVVTNPLNYHFNELFDKLFTTYSSGPPLMLTSTNNVTYSGTVMQQDGSGTPYVLRFTSSDDMYLGEEVWYDVYYPFFNDNRYLWATQGFEPTLTPVVDAPQFEQDVYVQSYSPTAMAFNANGVLADNSVRPTNPDLHYWNTAEQNTILANLENQLSAAINRGVALLPSSEWQDPSNYYKEHYNQQQQLIQPAVWNNYAQFLHLSDVSVAGLNYGFPYDDQTGQASDIGVSSFDSVTISLTAWDTQVPPPPPPPPPPPSEVSVRYFLASYRTSHQSSVVQTLPPPVAAPVVDQPPPQVDAAFLALAADDDDTLGLDEVLSGDDQPSDEAEPAPVQSILTSPVSARSFLSSRGGR